MSATRSAVVTAVALLAVIGALYGWTLYPGVGGRVNAGDSAKFQYIGKILGVPHQPGYPQYVVLNHLWTRLPLGLELAKQVNLLSAVLALVAGGFLFAALWRLSESRLAAGLGTATVLLSRSVWIFATEAEVHALHLVYVAALLWAVVRWRARRTMGWRLALVALFAAGCGNHPLMVAFVPGLTLLAAADWREALRPRFVAAALVILSLGAAQYGYLLWRAHARAPVVEAVPRRAGGSDLILAMTGFRFASAHLEPELTPTDPRLVDLARAAAGQLPLACLALAPLGAVVWWRRDRLLAGFALLTLAAGIGFILVYRIADWRPYLGPVWLWIVTLATVGWRSGELARWARRALVAAWILQLCLVSVVNLRRLHLGESPFDRSRLLRAAPSNAIVLAYSGRGYREMELARYYSLGLGLPRVTTARAAIEERWLFLEDRPLAFADPAAREIAAAHHVDYLARVLPGPPPLTLCTTGTEWPLDALEVRPVPGGAVVHRPDGTPLAEAGAPLQAIVVAGHEQRVKGVVSWPLATPADRRAALVQLPEFLSRVGAGDLLCILLQSELGLGRDPVLRDVSRGVLALPAAADEARVAVYAGVSGRLDLRLDPAEPFRLRIAQ